MEGTTDETSLLLQGNDYGPTFTGSGAIIVTGGDIDVVSNVSNEPPNLILVMAVDGECRWASDDDWYGTVAGNTLVKVGSSGSFMHPGDSGFPSLWVVASQPAILTYDIIDR